ncbi:hypothetical protein [Streptomyces anandii]|uniref:hypothetical protein n=1 Tax=Streptomyces anandii TaxID=285454 RepID=UPI0037980786
MGFLAAGVAGVLASTMYYLLRAFERRTRQDMQTLAAERRRLEGDMARREYELHRRKEALDRRVFVTELRLASNARTADMAMNENRLLRQRVLELEREIDEVNDERNQLITHELTLASAQFSRPYADEMPAAAGDQVVPLRRPRRYVLESLKGDC